MNLTTLKSNKGARHKRKRVGRGNGSGHGTFCCRGMNGQNARSGGTRRPGFEGGQTSFIQRMPKLKGFKNPSHINYQAVNVSDLNNFKDGDIVNGEVLYKMNLIGNKKRPVKILGNGDLEKKVTVQVDAASKSAIEKIEKAKGSCELKPKKEKVVKEKKVKAEKPAAAKEEAEAPAEAEEEAKTEDSKE